MCLISPDVFRSSVKDGCFISFNYFFSFHYNRVEMTRKEPYQLEKFALQGFMLFN